MRLYLKNVGKVSEADIKLDGITVIAGENNTGNIWKSRANTGLCAGRLICCTCLLPICAIS